MSKAAPAATLPTEDPGSRGEGHGRTSFWTLTLGSVGVVYGDIGTSPLYAFREAAHRGGRPKARSRARSCSACCR